MPYKGPNDPNLPANVQKMPIKKRSQWISVFNSSYSECIKTGTKKSCESKAFSTANGVVKRGETMKNRPIVSLCECELNLLEDEKSIEEAKAQGFVRMFEGIGSEVGRINGNGTLYRRSLMYREMNEYAKKIESRKALGLADHPGMFDGPSITRGAVRWLKADLDSNNNIQVRGGILDTRVGRDIAGILRGGVVAGISTRGRGNFTEMEMDEDHPEWDLNKDRKGETFKDVDDDYHFEAFDIVVQPSNEGAWGESQKQAAIERLINEEFHEEDKDMDIKTLADLKAALDESVFNNILAQISDNLRKDIEQEVRIAMTDQVATEVAAGVDAALADKEQICKKLGISESALNLVGKHPEKFAKLAEAGFDVTSVVPDIENAPDKDAKIAGLTEKVDSLTVMVNKLTENLKVETEKAADAAKALEDKKKKDILDTMIGNATKGKVAAEAIAREAANRLVLDSTEDQVKDMVEQVEKQFKEIAAHFNTSVEGKGVTGGGVGGGDEGGDKIAQMREAYAKEFPEFSDPSSPQDVVETGIGAINDPDKRQRAMGGYSKLFSKDALEKYPLEQS